MRDADARVLVCAAQRASPLVLAINCGGAGVTAARCTSVAHACCSLEIPGEPDALLRGAVRPRRGPGSCTTALRRGAFGPRSDR